MPMLFSLFSHGSTITLYRLPPDSQTLTVAWGWIGHPSLPLAMNLR